MLLGAVELDGTGDGEYWSLIGLVVAVTEFHDPCLSLPYRGRAALGGTTDRDVRCKRRTVCSRDKKPELRAVFLSLGCLPFQPKR